VPSIRTGRCPRNCSSCVEAARLAPSSCNSQPWRFVLVRDAGKRQAVFETARLPGINHQWLADAPVITALCAHKTLVPHRLAPLVSKIPYHYLDAAIAGEHFVLAATAVGLGSCWIGWFRQKPVKKSWRSPGTFKSWHSLHWGFQRVQPEKRTPRLSQSEIAFADAEERGYELILRFRSHENGTSASVYGIGIGNRGECAGRRQLGHRQARGV
jgi:hypothetical protein